MTFGAAQADEVADSSSAEHSVKIRFSYSLRYPFEQWNEVMGF
jgi:hypothetical protein